ncbi:DUF4367 domain-containing protein [Pseudoflavonifractor sp. An184]|uniref:DUF4367 domain-containing protein n=1 Tax=Pseudoflavonifractor sp. An184 TaxID=1965576 RepID=UPI000B3821EE|nr:DUF4367 domain-containing protein [Pseudoflavonifractor sp. An184]OUP54291.1 hypothetical protein B5F19_11525 [Pseudoflavonifractor sp. An184]
MISDSMLRSAAKKSCEIYVNQLESGYDPKTQHEFSPEFEKKIKRLRRKANHPIVYRSLQRIASIILVCLIACGAWFTVDAEARSAFFGWVKEIYETYFVYRFEGNADYSESSVAYRPTWLPEGYTEFYVDDIDATTVVSYQNTDGLLLTFRYTHNPNETDWFIDATHAVIKETTVNGYPAEILLADNITTASVIAWTDEQDSAFYVSGFLSESELIKIAENIQPLK